MYDSSVDTKKHIAIIQKVGNDLVIPTLQEAFEKHDYSKLHDPKEKAGYDKYVPMLDKVKYGTPEYFDIREQMSKNCFALHAKANPHHPEHYPDGVNGMNLFDLVCMFTDWFSAAQRSDTGFEKGLEINIKRFNIDPQLAKILWNTYERYYKDFVIPEEMRK